MSCYIDTEVNRNLESPLPGQRAIVVGAGIGGLVAALELAGRGLEVTVLERAAAPGGKMREVMVAGRPIDAGPTVFTLRPVFEAIFAAAGSSLDAHLVLRPVEVLARHAWNERDRLDLYADRERSAEAIAAFAGPAEGRGYRRFCERARRIWRTLAESFVDAPQPSLPGLVQAVGIGRLPDLLSISPFSTLWQALGEHFRDPRLRQLFGRYATYVGSSPFLAPATLMLVAHVEQEGVWLVEGGMHRLAAALAGLAAARGATFRYGAEVAELRIEGGRIAGVALADGEHLAADAVVLNADVAALSGGAFGRPAAAAVAPASRARRSLSAVTWALVARSAGFPLLRHNVFFSGDYRAEFDDLFGRSRLPAAPTVYVCAQDRDDRGRAGVGGPGDGPGGGPGDEPERLLCLVNAPATGDTHPFDAAEIEQCATRTFERLAACGLTLRPEASQVTTPADFARLFPATGGAIYGQASHGWTASFQRPGSRSKVPGLYLAGGSVHPGAGVPMAALSGRHAAASLMADLSSTGRSRRTAMPGGTSTR
ncbi:MAG: phytoene desaturase family protein [Dongiaceae bacterium]